jgi:8-oxo-dGTP pyrophosphatase MutT (NUDIX family)
MTCLIYNDAEEFLIMKRALNLKVYPGKWTVPGGGLETDDYVNDSHDSPDTWEGVVEKALRREINEEVGVSVGEFSWRGSAAFVRPDGIPVVMLRFAAPYRGGDVVLDPSDATEYAWVSAEDAPAYDFLGNILGEIQDFSKTFKQN